MNGITISQVRERVKWFSNRYSVNFSESGIYSLFPQEGDAVGLPFGVMD